MPDKVVKLCLCVPVLCLIGYAWSFFDCLVLSGDHKVASLLAFPGDYIAAGIGSLSFGLVIAALGRLVRVGLRPVLILCAIVGFLVGYYEGHQGHSRGPGQDPITLGLVTGAVYAGLIGSYWLLVGMIWRWRRKGAPAARPAAPTDPDIEILRKAELMVQRGETFTAAEYAKVQAARKRLAKADPLVAPVVSTPETPAPEQAPPVPHGSPSQEAPHRKE
jgi:hypothetical protein